MLKFKFERRFTFNLWFWVWDERGDKGITFKLPWSYLTVKWRD